MTLSIIIVNYKNPSLLRLCLKSIARHFPQDITCEIIAVDSETSPETQYVVTEEFADIFPHINILPFRENTGYTRGVNEGIKAARGEYMLILNPDIVILPGAIETMLNYARQNPAVGLLGPQLLNFDDSIQPSCFRFYTPLTILYRRIGHLPFARKILGSFLLQDRDLSKTSIVDWLMGSALMTSRQAIKRVGVMDERFFLYMSEVDWARRFWENGYAVAYIPQARLYHYHKRQSKGRFGIFDLLFKRETRWHVTDAIRYFQKWGIGRSADLPITSNKAQLKIQNL